MKLENTFPPVSANWWSTWVLMPAQMLVLRMIMYLPLSHKPQKLPILPTYRNVRYAPLRWILKKKNFLEKVNGYWGLQARRTQNKANMWESKSIGKIETHLLHHFSKRKPTSRFHQSCTKIRVMGWLPNDLFIADFTDSTSLSYETHRHGSFETMYLRSGPSDP